MAIKKEVIEIKIPSSSEYVGVVRLAISGLASRCNFSLDEIEDLKIAVSEACSNAVLHAYRGKKNGEIIVRCMPQKNKIAIEVADKGVGFDVKQALKEAGSGSKVKTPGLGLGLTFIKSLSDQLKISSRKNKGTTISFTKKRS